MQLLYRWMFLFVAVDSREFLTLFLSLNKLDLVSERF